MRGKARTTEQKHELFTKIEPYLKEGLSLRKACEITSVPYTTMRDTMEGDLLLRTKMTTAQSELLSLAWKNVRKNLEKGDVKTSQWYIEKMGTAEPLSHAYEGGEMERKSRSDGHLHAAIFGPKSTETIIEVLEEMDTERS
ncbi:MAG: hypothetical protein ACI9BF_000836 [Candidatus Paceibacteria bacterium]|jgi:hypothetical protein